MNDPFLVGGGQSMGDLQCVVQSLARRDRSAAQALPQCFSLQQFRNYLGRALVRANIKYRQNVGMVQGRGREGLLLKTAQPFGTKGKGLRQDLDRQPQSGHRMQGPDGPGLFSWST